MHQQSISGQLDVPCIPPQLEDVADDRSCWRGVKIDGEFAGVIGFNAAQSAGALYLKADSRWVVFWPVDRDALETCVARYLAPHGGARRKAKTRAH